MGKQETELTAQEVLESLTDAEFIDRLYKTVIYPYFKDMFFGRISAALWNDELRRRFFLKI